jgi:hypothetical protein
MGCSLNIVCKRLSNVPKDIAYKEYGTQYYFDVDYGFQEREILNACMSYLEIDDIYLSAFKPIMELVERLKLKDFLIIYDDEFAGVPGDNGYIIPVKNGKIMHKYIVADDYDGGCGSYELAFKLIGLRP